MNKGGLSNRGKVVAAKPIQDASLIETNKFAVLVEDESVSEGELAEKSDQRVAKEVRQAPIGLACDQMENVDIKQH